MIWVILFFVGLFFLGGLIALKPSDREKRIARLRQSATRAGLHVKLPMSLKFPEGESKSDSPYYCVSLADKKVARSYMHLMRDGEGQLPAANGDALKSACVDALSELGPDYKAAYLGSGMLCISWSEADATEVPDPLVQALRELKSRAICE